MPKRLLLALADEKLCQQLAKDVFAPAGYGVTLALTGAELRSALRSKNHDLLFLGDSLPGTDCFELAADLQSSHPDLPIILLAAQASPDGVQRSMQLGLVDYLTFPIDRKMAQDAAKRALERRRKLQGWLKRETGRITGQLKDRLSEMEAIISQVNDGVLVLDPKNRILMINPALRRDFSLGENGWVGQPVERLFPDQEVLEVLAGNGAVGERMEVQNSAGRIFHIRISRVPEVGTVASLHDISYLKELDRLRTDFVNTVSHDLRSPLTAILGYVELIERAGKVNPQQAQFIQRVKSSVHATTSLIDDLLNLGRVEVGMVDEVRPVDMRLIVANVLATMQQRVKEKRQILKLGRAGPLRPVLGSRTQLTQVVDNLIGNAIKYTRVEGNIEVKLSEEQDQLILHVIDNGPGIPIEDQGRIFEKFYRASNVGDGVPGTGLGLAIVKTIVDNHRGRIWVESKPGEGSVFTVVLPIAKEKD